MMQSRNKPYPGLFLTIEGGEGVGKSTFAGSLEAYLREKGHQVVRTREPGGTKLSEALRQLLLESETEVGSHAELLLFLAARSQHLEELILPALHAGKFVICERFHDSTIAYQGCARHLGMTYVEELCKLSTEGIVPDYTFFLDLDPEEGIKRIKTKRGQPLDRMEQQEIQFHREVRQGFLHLADKYPERIHILDAALPPEKVFAEAIVRLNDRS